MRSILLVMLMSGACSAQPVSGDAAAAQPTAESQPAAAAASGMEMSTDALLAAMERVGKELRTLKANIEIATTEAAFGNVEKQNGAVWIERLPDGDTRARVRIDDRVLNEKRYIERVDLLLAGDWLIQRDYGREGDPNVQRKETHRQVRQPGQKSDLLNLEGTFPLPIGQPPERVKEQFDVTRLPDDAQRPGLIVLELRPKQTNRLSERFESITVWVDPADALPRVIETIEPGGDAIKTTTLKDVKLNEPVNDADFTLEAINPDEWQVVKVPLGG